jgi:hypothetical protein
MKNKKAKQMWKSILNQHEVPNTGGDIVEVEWSKLFQPCYEEVKHCNVTMDEHWYYEFITLPVVSLTANQLRGK